MKQIVTFSKNDIVDILRKQHTLKNMDFVDIGKGSNNELQITFSDHEIVSPEQTIVDRVSNAEIRKNGSRDNVRVAKRYGKYIRVGVKMLRDDAISVIQRHTGVSISTASTALGEMSKVGIIDCKKEADDKTYIIRPGIVVDVRKDIANYAVVSKVNKHDSVILKEKCDSIGTVKKPTITEVKEDIEPKKEPCGEYDIAMVDNFVKDVKNLLDETTDIEYGLTPENAVRKKIINDKSDFDKLKQNIDLSSEHLESVLGYEIDIFFHDGTISVKRI